MMNKTLIVIALSAAFVALPASAQPYLGLGVGSAKTNTNNTSYKAFAGYQFIPFFGVEVAYNQFGDYYGSKAESWSVAAVGTIPLNESWDLFGKVGDGKNTTKFAGTATRHSVLTGVGVGFNVSKESSIRLEYEDFGKLPTLVSGVGDTVTNWSLSYKHSF